MFWRLFSFSGRRARLSFFLSLLIILLGFLLAGATVYSVIAKDAAHKAVLALMLPAIWAFSATTTQRLHDMNRTGRHTFWIVPALTLVFLPLGDSSWLPALAFIALIAIPIWLLVAGGTVGDNRFGPPPVLKKLHPVAKEAPPHLPGEGARANEPHQSALHDELEGHQHDWYYSQSGKRLGPIASSDLQKLLINGELTPNTMIWRAGMGGWVRAHDSEIMSTVSADTPPPLVATDVDNGFAWALAIAPVWATAFLYAFAGFYVGSMQTDVSSKLSPFLHPLLEAASAQAMREFAERFWFFVVIVNILMAWLDSRVLRAAGWKSKSIETLGTILVPIYLYKRDQLLGAGMARFWVWIGSFVVSILPIW